MSTPSIQSMEKAADDLRVALSAVDPSKAPGDEWSALRLRIAELDRIAARIDAQRRAAAH